MDIEKLYKTLTGEPYPYLTEPALPEPRAGGLLRAGGADKAARGAALRNDGPISRQSGAESH